MVSKPEKENAPSIFTSVLGLYGIVGRNDFSPVDDKIVVMIEPWQWGRA